MNDYYTTRSNTVCHPPHRSNLLHRKDVTSSSRSTRRCNSERSTRGDALKPITNTRSFASQVKLSARNRSQLPSNGGMRSSENPSTARHHSSRRPDTRSTLHTRERPLPLVSVSSNTSLQSHESRGLGLKYYVPEKRHAGRRQKQSRAPEAGHLLEEQKTYTVYQKKRLGMKRKERILFLDGQYVHVEPSDKNNINNLSLSYHIHLLDSATIKAKRSQPEYTETFTISFKIGKKGKTRKYNMKAETPEMAVEIVRALTQLRESS